MMRTRALCLRCRRLKFLDETVCWATVFSAREEAVLQSQHKTRHRQC